MQFSQLGDFLGYTRMTDFSLGHVEVSLSPLERFEEFLQSRGKRVTQQRRIIVEHIFRKHEHFDADSLIDEVTRLNSSPKVSRPTVYRTLRELVDAGLLRQMMISGRAVYEHDYGYPQHDHLHCQVCDKLIEFRSNELQQIRDSVASEHGFRVSGHRFIINGTCLDCLRAKRKRNSALDRI